MYTQSPLGVGVLFFLTFLHILFLKFIYLWNQFIWLPILQLQLWVSHNASESIKMKLQEFTLHAENNPKTISRITSLPRAQEHIWISTALQKAKVLLEFFSHKAMWISWLYAIQMWANKNNNLCVQENAHWSREMVHLDHVFVVFWVL